MHLIGSSFLMEHLDRIEITKKDEVYMRIECEPGIAQEICDYFTFTVPGHTFMPSFRQKIWDGKIRLYNVFTKLLYIGLLEYLCKFAISRKYPVKFLSDFDPDKVEASKFISTLSLNYQVRDYQLSAINHSLSRRRCLLLSPTASGKSLIIYIIVRYLNLKTLIIVPTTSLVSQMYKDFQDYGFDVEEYCHIVFAVRDKSSEKQVIISTWQSIYKLGEEYFKQYELVIGDEAHGFKSKSLTAIMTKCINARYRIGATGTLDGTQTHKLVLEGLFGKVHQVTTTKKLIDEKHLSPFSIKAIVLKHPDIICNNLKKAKYQDELNYLISCKERNKFIRNLTLDLSTNTLLLFRLVKKHGRILYEMIKEKADVQNRQTYFVYGGTDTETREKIRAIAEKERDAIIVASYGVYSTGINIRNLHNIIFASPSKSRIRNLQSIGRGLRKSENKEKATLYDIADDLSWKTHQNYTLDHFNQRMKIYNEERFDCKIYNVGLN